MQNCAEYVVNAVENLDAYDYFLRGLDCCNRLDKAQFDQAHEMFPEGNLSRR